jgi:hypothetical protein
MLTIFQTQINLLENRAEAMFCLKVDAFLRRNLIDARSAAPGTLEQPIMAQIQKARAYGLVTERQALTYVVTAWLLGERFDTAFPAAAVVLNDRDMTAEERRQWLVDWTVELFARLTPHPPCPILAL